MAENCELKWWKRSFVLLTILLTIAVTIIVAAITKLTHSRESQSRHNYTTEALFNVENRTSDNVSGGHHSPDYFPQKMYPSTNDKKKYFYNILPSNHLRVLLVWDPYATESAAAMTVGTGYYDDPQTHEGLAHLCEHMVEMGSEKYPDPEAYRNVVNSHGGRSRAETDTEHTLYHLTVPESLFSTALDIFAHFFISPLFPKDILGREIEAIHHEFLLNFNHALYTKKRLLNYVWNPNHPGHKFGIGDNTTLNKEDIHSQLKRFFNDKYSAGHVSSITISQLI